MILKINPNRMELLRLKKRLVLARRGHKLLKDKEDELMRRLLELIDEVRDLRKKVEEELVRVFQSFAFARGVMSKESFTANVELSGKKLKLTTGRLNVLNLNLPQWELREEGEFNYGFAETCADFDNALTGLSKILPSMVKLAQVEKALQLLAGEVERTRRRVNALEYIFIPDMEETVRHIDDRLSELERSNLTRLMKVKELVLEHRKVPVPVGV